MLHLILLHNTLVPLRSFGVPLDCLPGLPLLYDLWHLALGWALRSPGFTEESTVVQRLMFPVLALSVTIISVMCVVGLF